MPRQRTKNIHPTPFSQELVRYRKQWKLTMEALGQKIGVTGSYISLLESGEREPSQKLVKKLAELFCPEAVTDWLALAGYVSPGRRKSFVPDPFQAFIETLALNEKDFKTQSEYIRTLIQTGYYDRAKDQIQHCFQLFDNTVEIQALAGSLELAKGNYEAAIAAKKTAIQFYQANVYDSTVLLSDLLLSLGVCYFRKGYEHLRCQIQAEEKQQPAIADQEKEKAKKSFETARMHFQQALQEEPDDIYIWDEYTRATFNLAHLIDNENGAAQSLWQDTITGYQKVLRDRHKDKLQPKALLEAAVYLGHAYSKNRDFDEAEDTFNLIQATRPDYWLGHYAKACFYNLKYLQTGDKCLLDDSLDTLQRAIQIDDPANRSREEALVDPDLRSVRDLRYDQFIKMMSKGEKG